MTIRRSSRIVPVALGIAMLAVVLAAGLFPNAGTVRAQTSCPYGGCTTTSSIPTWELVSILVIIAAGAIAAALFLMRRRRSPPATPVQAWKEGPPTAGGPVGPGGAAPPYLETPEDVGHPPPAVPSAKTAAITGAAVAPAAGEGEPDIDSLMAELDKISGEILKKPPKKGVGSKGEDLAEDDEKST